MEWNTECPLCRSRCLISANTVRSEGNVSLSACVPKRRFYGAKKHGITALLHFAGVLIAFPTLSAVTVSRSGFHVLLIFGREFLSEFLLIAALFLSLPLSLSFSPCRFPYQSWKVSEATARAIDASIASCNPPVAGCGLLIFFLLSPSVLFPLSSPLSLSVSHPLPRLLVLLVRRSTG